MWTFGLETLDGTKIGEIENAHERTWTNLLNGVATAGFQIGLDNPLANEITSRAGDVRLKVYQDSTLRFHGELTVADEVNHWYRRVISRENLCNLGYSLGAGTQVATDADSIATRGLFEVVVPSDAADAGLRHALANEEVRVRANPQEVVTFQPIGDQQPTLTCAFSNPLWRLQKRLCLNDNAPVSPNAVSFTATDRAQILKALVDRANTFAETTVDTTGSYAVLYSTKAGEWNYKPISEAFTDMANINLYPFENPSFSSHTYRDGFGDPLAFNNPLNTKALDAPLTENWATVITGSGDFYVFSYSGGGVVGRAGLPENFAVAGNDVITGDIYAQIDFSHAAPESNLSGVFVRGGAPDITAECLAGVVALTPYATYVDVRKRTPPSSDVSLGNLTLGPIDANVIQSLRLHVIASTGEWFLWFFPTDDPTTAAVNDGLPAYPLLQGQDDDLKTTGALPSGMIGMIDAGTTSSLRSYWSFKAKAPSTAMTLQGLDFELAPIEYAAGKIATLNISASLGTDRPNAVFEGSQRNQPQYGTDYVVGDTVRVRAKYGGTVRIDATTGLEGIVRVYGFQLSIDDNGKEVQQPVLIQE